MRYSILILLALSASFGTPAFAGNDDEVVIGDASALVAGAVTATVNTGAALWYNPAGLANVRVATLDVSGSVYTLRVHQADRFMRISGRSVEAELIEVIVIPAAVTYVREIWGVRLGLGIFSPKSSDSVLRAALLDTPRPDTTADWSLTVAEREIEYHAVVGAGFSPHETLRLGVALHGVYRLASFAGQFSGVDRAAQPAPVTIGPEGADAARP